MVEVMAREVNVAVSAVGVVVENGMFLLRFSSRKFLPEFFFPFLLSLDQLVSHSRLGIEYAD